MSESRKPKLGQVRASIAMPVRDGDGVRVVAAGEQFVADLNDPENERYLASGALVEVKEP